MIKGEKEYFTNRHLSSDVLALAFGGRAGGGDQSISSADFYLTGRNIELFRKEMEELQGLINEISSMQKAQAVEEEL